MSTDGEVDVVNVHDPWAKAAKKLHRDEPMAVAIGNPMEDMEQRVVAAVLAKMPRNVMEVDSEDVTGQRVAKLEQQVSDLHTHAQTLQTTQLNSRMCVTRFNSRVHTLKLPSVRTLLRCRAFRSSSRNSLPNRSVTNR